jgi:hypothetical protein
MKPVKSKMKYYEVFYMLIENEFVCINKSEALDALVMHQRPLIKSIRM